MYALQYITDFRNISHLQTNEIWHLRKHFSLFQSIMSICLTERNKINLITLFFSNFGGSQILSQWLTELLPIVTSITITDLYPSYPPFSQLPSSPIRILYVYRYNWSYFSLYRVQCPISSITILIFVCVVSRKNITTIITLNAGNECFIVTFCQRSTNLSKATDNQIHHYKARGASRDVLICAAIGNVHPTITIWIPSKRHSYVTTADKVVFSTNRSLHYLFSFPLCTFYFHSFWRCA